MNEKKKRILPKLFAALVVLTLISCCFLGTTFAKYTSSTTANSTVTAASWDIKLQSGSGAAAEMTNTFDLEFGEMSPGIDADNSVTKTVTITNTGDVNALVDVTLGEVTWPKVVGVEDTDFENIFKVTFTCGDLSNQESLNDVDLVAGSGSITISITLTWKDGDDAKDTLIGKAEPTITLPITITATQSTVVTPV